MKKTAQWILGFAMISGMVSGQIAFDSAGNYEAWGDGMNNGDGFLAWAISSGGGDSGFAGVFLGDSTDGAGDINSDGQSFGLFANQDPGAFVNADRGFETALTVGDVFSFDLALNFDNGNKGFNLFAGTQGEVFNFNVGSGGGVSSNNATLNHGVEAGYDYGGNDAVLNFSFGVLSAEVVSYSISRSSAQGNQGVLFSGTVSNLFDAVSGFRFYNSATDNGDAQNNLYFNNLQVVPEPGTALLLVGGLGMLAWLRHRRG
ncbi:MAG: PEP-CTERM sorting domain-containing protein [Kiritimatiellae bacterium]|nr:PEP-CTERM sorting domain-containing protein [Kiritimatiellia bacterium]